MKLHTLLATLVAILTLALPTTASAKSRLLVVSSQQAPGTEVSEGDLQELLRIPIEFGSGPSMIEKIHLHLSGATDAISSIVVVSEEDTMRTTIDKNGNPYVTHSIKEKVVGRVDRQLIGVVVIGDSPEPLSSSVVVPITGDLIQSNGTHKSYVVYGLVGSHAWAHLGETVRCKVSTIEADANTEVGWMFDARSHGNEHTLVSPWFGGHPVVRLEAERDLGGTTVSSTRPVTLGSISVDVDRGQVFASNIEFELWSSTDDAKLFAALLDVRIVDHEGKMLQGTKPTKPQFKLESNRVKVTFPGLVLPFDEGKTALRFVGRFGTYNKNNPPLVTLVAHPRSWIWWDYMDSRIDPKSGDLNGGTVICPQLNFLGRPRKGG